jgi:hypothetical protein
MIDFYMTIMALEKRSIDEKDIPVLTELLVKNKTDLELLGPKIGKVMKEIFAEKEMEEKIEVMEESEDEAKEIATNETKEAVEEREEQRQGQELTKDEEEMQKEMGWI